MDLRLALTTAVLSALATILIGVMFGKRVAWIIGFAGTLSVLLPLILIVVFGVTGMLEADGAGVGQAASNTETAIINYMIENLPGLVISAVAGAVVGFIFTLIKKATPKKVRAKVKQRIRL